MFNPKASLLQLILFVGIAFPIAQTTSTNNDTGNPLCCYALCLPLWVVSIYYWGRHYYIRNGTTAGIIGGIAAFIFVGLGIFAMILDFLIRSLNGRPEVGSCPNCGKLKIVTTNAMPIPHSAQPRCPHCKQVVGDYYQRPQVANNAPQTPTNAQILKELKEMHEQGLISDTEYEEKRAAILKRL